MNKQHFHKRKEIRIPENLEIELYNSDLPNPVISARVTDISRNGLFLEPSYDLKKGTLLKVRLKLPDEHNRVIFLARVARVTKEGVGIEIESVGDEEKKRLDEFFHLSNLYGWFC